MNVNNNKRSPQYILAGNEVKRSRQEYFNPNMIAHQPDENISGAIQPFLNNTLAHAERRMIPNAFTLSNKITNKSMINTKVAIINSNCFNGVNSNNNNNNVVNFKLNVDSKTADSIIKKMEVARDNPTMPLNQPQPKDNFSLNVINVIGNELNYCDIEISNTGCGNNNNSNNFNNNLVNIFLNTKSVDEDPDNIELPKATLNIAQMKPTEQRFILDLLGISAADTPVQKQSVDNSITNGKISINGCAYEGELVNNIANGKGKITYQNGFVFEGNFVNNQPYGIGNVFDLDGNLVYVGEVKNDKAYGKGKKLYSDGSYYEGDYVNDLIHGYGTYLSPNGLTYIGAFSNHKPHGQGQLKDKTGVLIIGNFQNGKCFEGKIIFPNPSGAAYEGYYEGNFQPQAFNDPYSYGECKFTTGNNEGITLKFKVKADVGDFDLIILV